jgi:hypothetical protein
MLSVSHVFLFENCRIITSNPPTSFRPKQIRAGEYAAGRKNELERVNLRMRWGVICVHIFRRHIENLSSKFCNFRVAVVLKPVARDFMVKQVTRWRAHLYCL